MEITTNSLHANNPAFVIRIEDLTTVAKEELESRIALIAAHINEGKVFLIGTSSASKKSIVALNQKLVDLPPEQKRNAFAFASTRL